MNTLTAAHSQRAQAMALLIAGPALKAAQEASRAIADSFQTSEPSRGAIRVRRATLESRLADIAARLDRVSAGLVEVGLVESEERRLETEKRALSGEQEKLEAEVRDMVEQQRRELDAALDPFRERWEKNARSCVDHLGDALMRLGESDADGLAKHLVLLSLGRLFDQRVLAALAGSEHGEEGWHRELLVRRLGDSDDHRQQMSEATGTLLDEAESAATMRALVALFILRATELWGAEHEHGSHAGRIEALIAVGEAELDRPLAAAPVRLRRSVRNALMLAVVAALSLSALLVWPWQAGRVRAALEQIGPSAEREAIVPGQQARP